MPFIPKGTKGLSEVSGFKGTTLKEQKARASLVSEITPSRKVKVQGAEAFRAVKTLPFLPATITLTGARGVELVKEKGLKEGTGSFFKEIGTGIKERPVFAGTGIIIGSKFFPKGTFRPKITGVTTKGRFFDRKAPGKIISKQTGVGEVRTKFLLLPEKKTGFTFSSVVEVSTKKGRTVPIISEARVTTIKVTPSGTPRLFREIVRTKGLKETFPELPKSVRRKFQRQVFTGSVKPLTKRKGEFITGKVSTLEVFKDVPIVRVRKVPGVRTETTLPGFKGRISLISQKQFKGFKEKPDVDLKGTSIDILFPKKTPSFKLAKRVRATKGFRQLPEEPKLTFRTFPKPAPVKKFVQKPRDFGFPEQVPPASEILTARQGLNLGIAKTIQESQTVRGRLPVIRPSIVRERFDQLQRTSQSQFQPSRFRTRQKQLQPQLTGQVFRQRQPQLIRQKRTITPRTSIVQVPKLATAQRTRLAPPSIFKRPPARPKQPIPIPLLFPVGRKKKGKIFPTQTKQITGTPITRFVPSLTAISLGLREKAPRKFPGREGEIFSGLELRRLPFLPKTRRKKR